MPKWTLEFCQKDAKQYSTRSEWQRASHGYKVALMHKWLDICCAHMTRLRNPKGYWTLERCQKSASQHSSRIEWNRADVSAYDAARRHKWLDLCCPHMKKDRKPTGYWTYENCLLEAKKYSTRGAWYKASNKSYAAAKYHGWHEQCCAHMEKSKTAKRQITAVSNSQQYSSSEIG